MSFTTYMLRQEQTKRARAIRDWASETVTLAEINERLAELDSQHQPLADLVTMTSTGDARKALYAAAHYVVTGRFPA